MGHTPGPRCTKCVWIHEADSTAGTSFQGVGLCPVHASAPALLSIAQDCLHQLATDSDLDTILGAPKYRVLVAELRTVIAQATGLVYAACDSEET